MKEQLKTYKEESEKEMKRILDYWMKYAIDHEKGGFYGRIDDHNTVHAAVPKGSVLNSRILWSFSAAFRLTENHEYRKMADRAFYYLVNHFIDPKYGGVYWTVDQFGNAAENKKQLYALAFALYGITEYYLCSGNEEAKARASDIFETMVKYGYDQQKGGYFEAFSRDWHELKDIRLSNKDENEKKTMNTHLHILEAYTNLYLALPNEKILHQIRDLIFLFLDHIADPQSGHLHLFFDENWNPRSRLISYGHEIEAAWLIQEAAETINDRSLIQQVKERSVQLSRAAREGLDSDGGLWYEYDPLTNQLSREKHWWPQAEAMVGFFNAWQITGDDSFLRDSLNSWRFIDSYILDSQSGEWFWGIREDHSIMPGQDKAGIWKCPYHNTRACIQLISRINSLSASFP